MEFVASCFGVDPKKYRFASTDKKMGDQYPSRGDDHPIKKAILSSETEEKLKARSIAFLTVKCWKCSKNFEFPGVQKNGILGLICPNAECKTSLYEKYLKNRVTLFMKQLMTMYYEGIYKCNDPTCKRTSR